MSSYRAGAFAAPEGEVARLLEQARVIAAEERAALWSAGFPSAGLALEVGCGPGFFAEGLALAEPRLRLLGLEIDPFVLAEAKQRLPVVRGDARALPFAPAAFDGVYSRLFLRHVPGPQAVLEGLARLLRPGGCLAAIDSSDVSLLLDPVPEGFAAIVDARRAWFAGRGGTADMGHLLPGLFARAGLGNIQVRTVVVGSSSIGREAFRGIVLEPFLRAAERVLQDPARIVAAESAVQAWSRDEAAYGVITLFVVTGVR